MRKTRNWLANFSSRLGTRLFCMLSDCEDRGFLPRIARWAKIALLGGFIALAASVAAENTSDVIDCYLIVEVPVVDISGIEIEPNPTAGADSVTVAARAEVVPGVNPEGTVIAGANLTIYPDTVNIPMTAVDGKFDQPLEKVLARISVEGLEPGTTWIYVTVETSGSDRESQGMRLVITEEETAKPDSSETGTGSQETSSTDQEQR